MATQFVSIDVSRANKDFARLQRAYKTIPKKMARKYTRKAVTESTKSMRSELRAVTPRGATGNLRKGIKQSFKYRDTGKGFFKWKLGFNRNIAPHALLLEEGTKDRYTKAGAFRGHVRATWFLRELVRQRMPGVSLQTAIRLRHYMENELRQLVGTR